MLEFSELGAHSQIPPLEPIDLDVEPARSKWPTVLGVIGIIFGGLGLTCGCMGYFMVPLQRWGAEMQAQSGRPNPVAEATLHAYEQVQPAMFVLVTIGLLLSAWLLVGSIKLLRRQRSSRTHLVGWAIASFLQLALNIALYVVVFQSAAAELTQAGEANRMYELYLSMIGSAFGFLLAIAMQGFVLIWFSRARIKAEVESWR